MLIVNKGEIVASDSPDSLSRRLSGSGRLSLRLAGDEGTAQQTLSFPGIREITPQFTVDDWFDKLSEADIPVMRVNRIDTLEEDPHLQSINFFEQRQHPSEGSYVTTRHPVRFMNSPAEMRRDPPGLGQHNEEVLKEAGYSDDQIRALMEDGSLHALPTGD